MDMTELVEAFTSPVFGWVSTRHGQAFTANPSAHEQDETSNRTPSSGLTDEEE
jgi:hypothetical protein